jgi:transposase, IS5 family
MATMAIALQILYVDRGCRLNKGDPLPILALLHYMRRQMSEEERKLARRIQAIEPINRHLKAGHWLDSRYSKGLTGDAIHAVLCAAGCNKRLMRMTPQKGIRALGAHFFVHEIRPLFENPNQIGIRFQTKPIHLQPNLA